MRLNQEPRDLAQLSVKSGRPVLLTLKVSVISGSAMVGGDVWDEEGV